MTAVTVVTQVAAAACIASSLRANISEAKFDIVYSMGKKMDPKVAVVDSKFAALGKKMDAKFALVDDKFAKLDAKVITLDAKVDTLHSQLRAIAKSMETKSMETKSASRADAALCTIGAILCTGAVVVYCSRK